MKDCSHSIHQRSTHISYVTSLYTQYFLAHRSYVYISIVSLALRYVCEKKSLPSTFATNRDPMTNFTKLNNRKNIGNIFSCEFMH